MWAPKVSPSIAYPSPKPSTNTPPEGSPELMPEGPSKRHPKSPFFPSLLASGWLGLRFVKHDPSPSLPRTRASRRRRDGIGLGAGQISFSECQDLAWKAHTWLSQWTCMPYYGRSSQSLSCIPGIYSAIQAYARCEKSWGLGPGCQIQERPSYQHILHL